MVNLLEQKFRSRKWRLSLGIQLFSSAALILGMLDGNHYAQITMANIGSYNLANAAEHYSTRGPR